MTDEQPDPPDVVGAAEDLLIELLRTGALLLAPLSVFGRTRQSAADTQLQRRIELSIWRLERAYATLTKDPQALHQVATELTQLLGDLRPLLLAWVDLVESLAHEAERTYGTGPGRGTLKQLQVKAAILYLIDRSGARFTQGSGLPPYLEPLVLDIGVGWIVDMVVHLLNRYQLWDPSLPSAPAVRRRVLARTIVRTYGLFRRLSDWLERLAWRLVLLNNPLAPGVRAAADRVGAAFPGSLESTIALVTWGQRHHAQVTAFFELVGIVVNEAEGLMEMSDPEKKAYARTTILTVLRQNGLTLLDLPFGQLLIGGLVDGFIDAVVLVIHKNDPRRKSALASTNG